MKKIVFPIFVVALFISCSSSTEESELTTDIIDNPITSESSEADKEKLPHFEFVEEVKDFGTITQGEVVSTSFRFKNVGQSNLIISSAQGSCGCTVPEWPKEPIMPGEEGQIKVKFNSDKKPNLQQKTITLVTNTEQGKEILKIKAQVTPKSKVQQNS